MSLRDLHPGNAPRYAAEAVAPLPDSPLAGRHLLFLGSSVTYGAASRGVSFADYLAARTGCTFTKEAVSGTTLADTGEDAYIPRMKRMRDKKADLFVCQLSTNDAARGIPLGTVPDAFRPEGPDTSTVAGAIGAVICYAEKTWGCPVAFYTSPRFESDRYAAMVALLRAIADRRGVPVIDMWNDEAFNRLTPEERALYMADPVHPTQAGYLLWWTPYMETAVLRILSESGKDRS